MSLTDMVLMPGKDYQAICDAIRARTGGTAPLKSGDIAAAISGITDNVGALGEYMYSFGVISDTHLDTGRAKTRAALQYLKANGAEFIVATGDIANSGAEVEFAHFRDDAAAVDIDVFASNGNHDYTCTDETWQTYLGHPLRHVIERNSDVYIILPLNACTGYGENNIQWLSEQLAIYKGRRIFIATHFPLPEYAGLRPDTYYGFSSTSTEDDEILALMTSTRNVIHLSGHTHLLFDVEDTYPGINCVYMPHCRCATIHIPSTATPRTADWTVDQSQSEGYLADVYKNAIVFRGIDFVNGVFMDGRVYVIPITHSTIPEFTNAIVTSVTDMIVTEGGIGTFSVRLANPIVEDVVVGITVDNANITLSANALTFAPESYGVEQTVIVSAIDDDVAVDMLSVVTISAPDMLPKQVSVTVANTDAVMLTAISADYLGGNVPVGTSLGELAVVVTASYSNGTTEAVTDYTLSGEIAEGDNTITVSYGGLETTFVVTGITQAQQKTVIWSRNEIAGTIGQKGNVFNLATETGVVFDTPMEPSKTYYIRADSLTDADGNAVVPAQETVYINALEAYVSEDLTETSNGAITLPKYGDFVTGLGVAFTTYSSQYPYVYGYKTFALRAASGSTMTFPETFTIKGLEIYTLD